MVELAVGKKGAEVVSQQKMLRPRATVTAKTYHLLPPQRRKTTSARQQTRTT